MKPCDFDQAQSAQRQHSASGCHEVLDFLSPYFLIIMQNITVPTYGKINSGLCPTGRRNNSHLPPAMASEVCKTTIATINTRRRIFMTCVRQESWSYSYSVERRPGVSTQVNGVLMLLKYVLTLLIQLNGFLELLNLTAF